jgi:chromosome segregation ATPase
LKIKNAESELLILDLRKKILALEEDRTKSIDFLKDSKYECLQITASAIQIQMKLECAQKTTIETKKLNVSYTARIDTLESSIEKLDLENIGLTANVEQCKEKIHSINQINEALKEKLNDTTNEKEGLCSKLAESSIEKQAITNELSKINDYNSNIKEELVNQESDCKKFRDYIQKLEEDKLTFQTETAAIKSENINLTKQLLNVNLEKEKLIDDMKLLKVILKEKDIELKKFTIDTEFDEMVVDVGGEPPDEDVPNENPDLDFQVCR